MRRLLVSVFIAPSINYCESRQINDLRAKWTGQSYTIMARREHRGRFLYTIYHPMYTLREKLADPQRFLLGVELVSTRGTMEDHQAIHTRSFATQLVQCNDI